MDMLYSDHISFSFGWEHFLAKYYLWMSIFDATMLFCRCLQRYIIWWYFFTFRWWVHLKNLKQNWNEQYRKQNIHNFFISFNILFFRININITIWLHKNKILKASNNFPCTETYGLNNQQMYIWVQWCSKLESTAYIFLSVHSKYKWQ